MNEPHRSAAAPSKAEIVFSVTSGMVSTGVQVGGAAVMGAANGLVKGLWWLARNGASAVAQSRPCQGAVAKLAEAWHSATKAVVEREAAQQQAAEESHREEED